jgi:hypothetical protein
MRNFVIVCSLAGTLAGCVTAETVQFRPNAQQHALIRDGQAALVSRRQNSLVMISPASRQFQAGARPVFVVGINNLTRQPIDFRVANVDVRQIVNQNSVALKVFTFDELMTEERNRQIAAAIIGGLAVAANSYSAATAGRYNSTSTVTTPRGSTYLVNTSGYSPAAAAIAQANANAQNNAVIASTIEQGQLNMAALERGIIKDNTLLPGEWYGGKLVLQPPNADGDGPKTYSISLKVGPDQHEIEITQAAVR